MNGLTYWVRLSVAAWAGIPVAASPAATSRPADRALSRRRVGLRDIVDLLARRPLTTLSRTPNGFRFVAGGRENDDIDPCRLINS
jgi:hypothetical protein